MTRLPALFLGHGSPMTTITDTPERRAWQALGRALPRPRAILAVTAHWETHGRTHLTADQNPRTIHDFRGFPQELYEVRYAAPGAPWLVDRVARLLGEERVARDTSWGLDHGAWGVLLPMFPAADVPVVALSLDRSLTPEQHLETGRRLAPLRDEGVLVVASGNLIHNLRLWRQAAGTRPDWAEDFRTRCNAAIVAGDDAALLAFAAANGDHAAALALDSGEHFLPLLYALGTRAPGEPATVFTDTLDGALSMTSVLVGDPALLAAR